MSTKSRSSVKTQSKDAEKAGTLQPAGQATQSADTPRVEGKSMSGSSSTKSRAAVKGDAKAARSSGLLQPAGEAPKPAGEAPKK